jgi:hypothetical protein
MRRRTLIELVLSLLLLVCAIGAYAYGYVEISKASAKAGTLAAEVLAKGQDSERNAAAKDALDALSSDEAGMRSYFVKQEDIVPFLGMLEQKGTSLGSSLEVVSVSAEPAKPRGRILLSVKVTGSFDAVMRTLGAIEYGPYDSRVSNVTFDVAGGEGSTTPAWTAAATIAVGTQPLTP